MSGAKGGSVPIAAIVIAPVAVGAIAVAAGGVVGVYYVGKTICTGVARLTKECSDKVNEYTENIIQEEIKRIREDLDSKKSDISALLKNQPDLTPDLSRLSSLISSREKLDVDRYQSIISALSQVKDERHHYEDKKGLDPIISKRIAEQIEEYENKKKQKEKEVLARRAAVTTPEADKKAQKAQALHLRVREMLEVIRNWYPDVCIKVESQLERGADNNSLSQKSLKTIIRTNNLEKRIRAVSEHTEQLEQLTSIRLAYETDIRHRDKKEYEAFQKIFNSTRDRAEQALDIEPQIKKLQSLLQNHTDQSAIREREVLHKMSCDQAKTSLSNSGYSKVASTNNNRYRVLVGTAGDGRKATIWLALPGQNDDKIEPVRTEIDQGFYKEDQEDRWNNAGRELVRHLESAGLVIDFAEVGIIYKGRWAIHAEEVLKNEARTLGFSEKQVGTIHKTNTNVMSINGRDCECPATMDVKEFLKKTFDAQVNTGTTTETERHKVRS